VAWEKAASISARVTNAGSIYDDNAEIAASGGITWAASTINAAVTALRARRAARGNVNIASGEGAWQGKQELASVTANIFHSRRRYEMLATAENGMWKRARRRRA
jgi:hypothetical protein